MVSFSHVNDSDGSFKMVCLCLNLERNQARNQAHPVLCCSVFLPSLLRTPAGGAGPLPGIMEFVLEWPPLPRSYTEVGIPCSLPPKVVLPNRNAMQATV